MRHNPTGWVTIDSDQRNDVAKHEEFDMAEPFQVIPAGVPVASVEISFGMTINLGNYESARVDVGCRIPCSPDDVDKTFGLAKKWATSKVKEEVRSIKGK